MLCGVSSVSCVGHAACLGIKDTYSGHKMSTVSTGMLRSIYLKEYLKRLLLHVVILNRVSLMLPVQLQSKKIKLSGRNETMSIRK